MKKTIEIRGLGKPSDDLMTVTEPDGTRYLVFDKAIFPYIEIGKTLEADVELDVEKKDKSGTYNFIRSITIGGEVIGGKPKAPFKRYGKSPEELTQQRQLAEAQNRSIQAQTALNRAVDLAVGGCMPIPKQSGSIDISIVEDLIGSTARSFYQLLQSLTQISEAEVIESEVKQRKAKDKEAKLDDSELPEPALGAMKRVAEAVGIKPADSGTGAISTVKELMEWAMKHDKMPSDVREALELKPLEKITNIPEAVETLKEHFEWED